jgi:diguanylate cyclase (GGDEF)-like protein
MIDENGERQLYVHLRDITKQHKSEQIIRALARQSVDAADGEEFFRQCLQDLADFYGTRYAFIGLLTGKEPASVRTFVVYADGHFADNFEYGLAGTPCEEIINLTKELIPANVTAMYPEDRMLASMAVDSYFGCPLVGTNGEMIGLISVMDDKPLRPEAWAIGVLEVYGSRIAVELERKRTEDELHGVANQLSWQASHDGLTGLMNRHEFDLRLQRALDSAQRDHEMHALCYLDLDQFKVVNDTCGHTAGDMLLKQLAVQVLGVIRDSDTLARLGGDEFGILLYDCPVEKAKLIAGQVLDVIRSFRFVWQERIFEVGASIGIVPLDVMSGDRAEALSAADSACYMAKELGRNRVYLYQADDAVLSKRHGEMEWVSRLHEAIDRDEFLLYVQQIMPINEQDSTLKQRQNFEVLLRLQDDGGQLIPPGAFLPAAERYNLMGMIDRYVVTNVLDWLVAHPDVQAMTGLCTINISGQSLGDERFLEFLKEKISGSSVPANMLCFEVTETAAVANLSLAITFMEAMKQLGCSFALDDFGSGMSSFSYLKNLPVDFLKIDGYFVRDIVKDPIDKAMVRAIHEVGRVMGLQTIAEFVENDEILAILRQIGVNYAQGYGVARPEPIDSLLQASKRVIG